MKITKRRGDFVYNQYLKCVFDDPNFQKELDKLRGIVEDFERKNPGKVFVGTNNEHCEPKEAIKLVNQIIKEYEIEREDIDDLFTLSEGAYSFNEPGWVYKDKDSGTIIVEMFPDIKEKDYRALWEKVDRFRSKEKKNSRDTGQRNYPLLYAIHRARKKNLTFPDIKELLDNEKLELYEGRRYGGNSEDLKAMYQTFKSIFKE